MSVRPVSVVVVSYNTSDKLRQCLACIDPIHEIIVVDNASTDSSCQMVQVEFPNVILIKNDSNKGFGAANNQGMDRASHDLILLLNSDAYAGPGSIEILSTAMDDQSVVACGGRLLNLDGSLQQSSCNDLTLWAVFCEQTWLEKIFPRSSFFSPYWNSWRLNRATPVAQVMGACLMMRSKLRFDERFFLYCEDTELCFRLNREGKILYVPEASFTHELGSSSAVRWEAVARYNRGKELFFEIHFAKTYSIVCLLLDRLGALVRILAWLLTNLIFVGTRPAYLARAQLFWRVLTAPWSGPPRPS